MNESERSMLLARARSDIYLAVSCSGADSRQWSKVMEIIEEADTLLEIDCVRFDTLTETDPLRTGILRHKLPLFERPA